MALKGSGSTLKSASLRKFCEDIEKHSIQFQDIAKKMLYSAVQRTYSQEILETVLQIDCVEGVKTVSPVTWDFIFNKYLKEIDLSSRNFNEEIASVISRNCESLSKLTIRKASLIPEIYVPFFTNIHQLTSLHILECTQLSLEIFEAIANSLIHLTELAFSETSEKALYILSGHKQPGLKFSIPNCCYTHECNIISPLKLQKIFIGTYEADEAGIACLLTHIPTLRLLEPTIQPDPILLTLDFFTSIAPNYALSQVISNIHAARAKLGAPVMIFEVEIVEDRMRNMEDWGTFLHSCPKLEVLGVYITQSQSDVSKNLDEALAQHELVGLKTVAFYSESIHQMLTDKFFCFWKMTGHRLSELHLFLRNIHSTHTSNGFRSIIMLCPNLQCLTLIDAHFSGHELVEDFPKFPHLAQLTLFLQGNADIITTFTHKIICSAANLSCVTLSISAEKEFFVNMLNTKAFPKLTNVTVL